MNQLLDHLKRVVKRWMAVLARAINRLSGGRLRPNHVTLTSLGMHLPVAWLIAVNHFWWAALFLLVFGLFDALDGELARLQNRASSAGMVLDASTDRFKEVILYLGVSWAVIGAASNKITGFMPMITEIRWSVLIVLAALGGSLVVSYVKAKGETAVKDSGLTPNEVNRLFQDGLARYEVRMALLIAGLLANQLLFAVAVIAVLSWITAIDRLIKITQKLNVQG